MDLKTYLEKYPSARESSNRNQAVWGFLSRKYGFTDNMPRDWFWKHGQEIDSTRRQISEIQKHNEHLRGKDYDDKDKREQEWLLKNGYEVGYYQDIKPKYV